jgi:hypothetical protein
MTRTIKFTTIHEMLEWIVENEFFERIPVDLTIYLED